jgi:hypothetical protein
VNEKEELFYGEIERQRDRYKKALKDIHHLFEGEVIDDSEEIPVKVLDIVLDALKED